MAPEHLRALVARTPDSARQVDHRSDLYGLGMVLYEMLTGQRPFDQSASYSVLPVQIEAMAVERSKAAPSLRRQRPDVPWSLESIARKCLAPDAAARYQQAEHLAEDLRCFLDDRPLRHAPELSQVERVQKWVRRHPRLAAAGSVVAAAAVLLAAGGLALAALWNRLEASEQRAHEAEGAVAHEWEQAFMAGAERARCLLNTTTDWHDHIDEGLTVCENTLALYEILDREDWQAHPAWQRLDPTERRLRAEDARELLLLLARARVRRAPAEADPAAPQTLAACAAAVAAGGSAARGPVPYLASWAVGQSVWRPNVEARQRALTRVLRQALVLLERAEGIEALGPSAALWRDRADYLEKLGDARAAQVARLRAQEIPPASARDHYLLASSYAQEARSAQAVTELKQALRLNPRDYWSWFHLGMCHYELGEYVLAAGDFSACIGLWPEFAWGYFNRGQVLQRLGKYPEAREDYSTALRCNPDFADAYLNRGLLGLQLNEPGAALADLEAACARAGPAAWGQATDRFLCRAHAGRGIALEGLDRPVEADAAFSRAWQHDPENADMLLGYGFAIARRRPQEARDAFWKVLRREPRNPRALYGYAMLLAQQARQSEAALACFTLALEADPTFLAARLGRANVLAHRGEWEKARQEIEWCVRVEPSGMTLYAAACVYALMAESVPEPLAAAVVDRAIHLLREAFARGYGRDKAAADSDLAALRNHPDFRRLVHNR
jgi:tetratricopeptide (TPR) repeat protein